MKKRNPLVAALFSLIEPGLGFVYNGRIGLGLLITATSWVIIFGLLFLGIFKSFYASSIAIFVFLIFRVVIAIISAFHAKQIDLLKLGRFNRWYIYSLFLLVPLLCRELHKNILDVLPQRVFMMPSVSMEPLIQPDEGFVADMRYYNSYSIEAGDVVVFRPPSIGQGIYVKRCIAVPGQRLEIRDAIIYINDHPFLKSLPVKRSKEAILSPDYKDDHIVPTGAGNEDQYGPIVIPDGYYFMLGDHRDNSLDSRYFGFVPKENILGKALYILSYNKNRLAC
jgi:signal peptidase I